MVASIMQWYHISVELQLASIAHGLLQKVYSQPNLLSWHERSDGYVVNTYIFAKVFHF